MSLLLETIRVNQGKAENLQAHEDRISHSQLALEGIRMLAPLPEIFEENPPPSSGLLKARLVYNHDLYKLEYSDYQKKEIQGLKIWQDQSIYYPFKFANRSLLECMKKSLPEHTEALIVIGDRITDTTYTNVAFWNGKKWLTPQYPLLKGTMRDSLLKKRVLEIQDISLPMLENYERIRLFNAMMPWEEAIELPVYSIIK